jgi:hypothetical protein
MNNRNRSKAMDEQLAQLIERRDEISFLMIEASGQDYQELEIELEELNAEIEALGGDENETEEF